MSAGDWALVIGAAFWGLLVLVLCILLLNLFRLVSALSELVNGITDETVPLIGGLGETVSGVNVELARVDAVVAGVQEMTQTANSTVSTIHAVVANPMIKVAAWTAGALAAIRAARAMRH